MYYVPRSFIPQQYSSSGKRDQDRPSWDLHSRGGDTHNKQNPGCPALVSIMKENKSGAGVETRKGQGGRLLGEAGSERRAKSGRYLQKCPRQSPELGIFTGQRRGSRGNACTGSSADPTPGLLLDCAFPCACISSRTYLFVLYVIVEAGSWLSSSGNGKLNYTHPTETVYAFVACLN